MMMQILTYLTLLVAILAISLKAAVSKNIEASAATLVDTPLGSIEGFEQQFLGKKVITYLGIPFAEPPVGELRFKDPIPVKPRDPIHATAFSFRCPSDDLSDPSPQSEDCLYLNVWRPACRDDTLKPVMVWIYGGGFVFGSANSIFLDPLALVSFGDVVVVTFNYRIGALGFTNLDGVDDVNGNAGLMDQVAALQWVNKYIHLFGGDPDQITLFGVSAGGFSVGYHLVSPLSQNLFRRAIIQSGGTYGDIIDFNSTRSSLRHSARFAELVGCESKHGSVQVLQCLQKADLNKIMDAQRNMLQEQLFGTFGPSIDKTLMPDFPKVLLSQGKIGEQVKEVLIGVTSDEGSVLVAQLAPQIFGKETPKISEEMAKKSMSLLFEKYVSPENIEEVTRYYIGKYGGPLLYKAVYEALGDYTIACPAVFTSEDLSTHGRRVFFYEFAYRFDTGKRFLDFELGGEWTGARHGEEVPFVFGIPLRNPDVYTEEAIHLSKRIMDTWVTFAKTGTPSDQLGHKWPLFTKNDPRYLVLKPNVVSEEVGHHKENCEIWRPILQDVVSKPSTECKHSWPQLHIY